MIKFYMGHVFAFMDGPEKEILDFGRHLQFFNKESLHRFNVPRFKYLMFEDTENIFRYKIYSGLVPFATNKLRELGIQFQVEKDTSFVFKNGDIFTPPDGFLKGSKLRDYQIQIVRKAVYRQRGIIALPTRSGKTEIAAAIIKHLNRPTLFLVHRENILRQTYNLFKKRGLGDVVMLGGGTKGIGKITVATVQTLLSRIEKQDNQVAENYAEKEVVFFDEVHHLKATTWRLIGEYCNAPYRFGLSATPFRETKEAQHSFDDMALVGLTGDVIAYLSPNALMRRGYLARPRIYYVPVSEPVISLPFDLPKREVWHRVYTEGVVENNNRNAVFVDVASRMYKSGMKVLMLVTKVSHGKDILSQVIQHVPMQDCIFVKGSREVYSYSPLVGLNKNRWPFEMVRSFIEDRKNCIVVGTSVMDEGVDVPSLNAVLILSAQRSFQVTVQRAGRSLTPKKDGSEAWIVDAMDRTHPTLLRQAERRSKILREIYNGADFKFGISNLMEDLDRDL